MLTYYKCLSKKNRIRSAKCTSAPLARHSASQRGADEKNETRDLEAATVVLSVKVKLLICCALRNAAYHTLLVFSYNRDFSLHPNIRERRSFDSSTSVSIF